MLVFRLSLVIVKAFENKSQLTCFVFESKFEQPYANECKLNVCIVSCTTVLFPIAYKDSSFTKSVIHVLLPCVLVHPTFDLGFRNEKRTAGFFFRK